MGCESSDAIVSGAPHSITPSNLNNSNSTKVSDNYYKLLKAPELLEANKLFAHDQFAEAAAIYQQYLEDHGDETPENIDGVGQLLISLGYYQWNLYKHYK